MLPFEDPVHNTAPPAVCLPPFDLLLASPIVQSTGSLLQAQFPFSQRSCTAGLGISWANAVANFYALGSVGPGDPGRQGSGETERLSELQ